MKDPSRACQELVEEIALLKQRIEELEQSETEHLQTLEALQRSEMKFRTLYDSTSDAVLLLDRNSFFDCNNAALKLFGCGTREELCGIHPADLSPPVQACGTESRVLGDHYIAMALKNGPQQFEWTHKRVDTGEIFPSEALLSPMIIDGKSVLQVVVRDITRQKRMEEALLKEMAFNSTLVESSPAFFVAINADRTVRHMNEAMLRALGYSLEEVKDKDYVALVPESDRERLLSVFSRLITWAQPTFNENRVLTKDGKEILVEWHGRAIRKPDGSPDYFFGVGTDITDRKRAEEELWESNQKFQSLVETLYDWVWEVDCEGRYTYVSPQIKNILGYDPEEILGKTAFDLMSPEDAKRLTKTFTAHIKKERPLVAMENINIHKDGRLVVLETDGLPFYDAAGDLKGYRGTDRDITERKKMEEELKVYHEHLEQLVAKRTAALREEITRREDRENELSVKSKTLEEVNSALRVLLKQREEDRKELEAQFVSNIRTMILPYIRKIKKEQLIPRYAAYLDLVETNLAEILSPLLNMVKQFGFTPKETEVVSFIRQGKTTKDIARIMGVAPSAVNSHRDNIRKKLGLNNKKANLRTHLLSLK